MKHAPLRLRKPIAYILFPPRFAGFNFTQMRNYVRH